MSINDDGSAGPASAARGGIDAVKELRSAPFRPQHLLLTVAILLANVFDGYDTLNPSYVISFVAKPWHLSHSASGFMVSSGLIGFMIGALVHGPIADRIGRRPVLLGALGGAGLLSVLTATGAHGFTSFVLLRLVTGLFLGSIMPLGTAYIHEFTPAGPARKVVVATVSGYSVGGVLSSFVGIYATPQYGWTSLYWIGGLSLVLALLLIPILPESVHYLVMAGRHDAVARVLAKMRPDRAADYRGATFSRPRALAPTRETIREIVSATHRRTSITLWICAFLILFCIYGLSGWLPSVMQARGNGFAASFASIAILQFAGIVGGLVVSQISDRRRSPTSMPRGISVLMVISTVAIIVLAFGTKVDLLFIGMAGVGIIGGQNALVAMSADSYPTHARSTGTGSMFGMGRVGGILGPYLIGWLLDWSSGNPVVVFIAIAIATAGSVVAGIVLTADRKRRPQGSALLGELAESRPAAADGTISAL